jgi:hypothetical protein
MRQSHPISAKGLQMNDALQQIPKVWPALYGQISLSNKITW